MKKLGWILGLCLILGGVIWSYHSPQQDQQTSMITSQRNLANVPSANAQKPVAASSPKAQLNEIKQIEACYQSNTCDYPQTDPKSYSIAVGHDLADKIKIFRQQYKSDPTAQKDLNELARHAVHIDDGFVQSEALDIFKELPISAENLQAMNEGLQYNTDPLIAEKALTELQRYMGTDQENNMQQLVQSMLQGAHFSSQKVAESILRFINEQSFQTYQQIQKQLPPQSRTARDLGTALREYQQQRSGG